MVLNAASSRAGRKVAAATAAAILGTGAFVAVSVGQLLALTPAAGSMTGVSCPADGVAVGEGDGRTGLNAEQIKNSQVIIAVGQQMQIPTRGHVVAIAAALQESGLRNVAGGDRDSLGLFQMRPSMGWGTREQILTPSYSAQKFFTVLQGVSGWEGMSITDAAQAVERSGFPDAYAKHEKQAVQIVASIGRSTGAVTQVDTSGCSPAVATPAGPTGEALQVMLQQVGKPYVWGATGPDSFDCSGLIVYGWRKAGYELTVRTSQQMADVTTPVPSGDEQPGDLIFSEFDRQAGVSGPAHVMVVVSPGLLVEAPRPGKDVRVRQYNAQKEGLRFGRLTKGALTAKS
ncbi:C40 family peptidase [Streptomyces lunalinharesii]|uniref:NlpC/P60 domain-containing protein n=1 Tax=Streptomyces lunalinharesii TaxID=333384 RepID=A0ABN3SVI0_9ACTN